jgi:iron complex transport system permease protein
MIFGACAIAAGVAVLLPSFTTAVALGLVLVGLGLGVSLLAGPQWTLLGTANAVVGALTIAGGVLGLARGQWWGFAISAALFMALAIAIRSALLSALTVLVLAGLLGSSTGYTTATYFLEVDEPTVTIVLFAALALAAYLIGRRVSEPYERVAFAFARVALIMVNFGFWIGSLWGDEPGKTWLNRDTVEIPAMVFVVLWALALAGVGIWAARANRRFVVNTVATFGGIHFYTQWFERLGAQPVSLALAGVIVVAVAVALWRYNAEARRDSKPAPLTS